MIRSIVIMMVFWAGSAGAESPSAPMQLSGLAPEDVGASPPLRPDVFPPVATGVAPEILASEDVIVQMDADGLLAMASGRMQERVGQYWNLGALAVQGDVAMVTIAFSMMSDGLPTADSFEIVDSSTAEPEATNMAFFAARVAVIRCAGQGYDMPAALFAEWRNIEMTFDPNGMAVR